MTITDPIPEPDPTDTPDLPPPDTGVDLDPNPDPVSEAEKWKAMARKHEKAAKANADAAARLQAIEDAAKSDQEKAAEALATAQREAAQAKVDLARLTVATSKGLPPELAARLIGETAEEMAEDADRLLAVMTPAAPPAPTGSADGGPQGVTTPGTPSLDEQIAAAQAAGNHRLVISLNNQKLAHISGLT